MEFRQRADFITVTSVDYPSGRHKVLQEIYGFPLSKASGATNVTQYLGSVLCRDNRSITYPNYIQNRMCPFELVDKSKPGYRKMVTLHLVDPHLRIISTAHVPPQQKDWGAEKRALVDHLLTTRLPPELKLLIEKELDLDEPMTLDEAKKYRLDMIEERKKQAKRIQTAAFERGEFELREAVRPGTDVSTDPLQTKGLSIIYIAHVPTLLAHDRMTGLIATKRYLWLLVWLS